MQCEGPPPGEYYIMSQDGLGVTFTGNMTPLTISSSSSKWMVGLSANGSDSLTTIAPVDDPGFQVGPAGSYVEVLPTPYAWCISNKGIMDPKTGLVWTVNAAMAGERIMLEQQLHTNFQSWYFIPA